MLIAEHSLRYWIIGKETGQSGTFHYQGYMYYENPQKFSVVKNHIPRAHIERQRGSIQQAVEYCKKDGNFEEWGTKPMENNANRKNQYASAIQKAKDGDLAYIEENHPQIWLRYLPRLQELYKPTPEILTNFENEWWYGPTGTGKSSKAWNDHPTHYSKNLNKWWDGYNHEAVVVIEEWSPTYHMLGSMLKKWADRFPFNAEIKGGTLKNIRPQKIIITSNYSMDQCFPKNSDLDPLKRRFKVVHFPATPFTQAQAQAQSSVPSEVNDEDFLDNELTDFITSLVN